MKNNPLYKVKKALENDRACMLAGVHTDDDLSRNGQALVELKNVIKNNEVILTTNLTKGE